MSYNGWTNYATWRINLELFDGVNAYQLSGRYTNTPSEIKDLARDYAENIIFETSIEGLARDYALAFISDVNWWEIANHLIANLEDETDYPDGVDDPEYVVTGCE
jgi:hypothetical protein